MNLLTRFLRITTALILIASSAMADIPQELQDVVFSGALNARSSVDFRAKANNIKGIVPKDSEGTILETRQLKRTGSYGLKVRITKVGETTDKSSAKVGDDVWVYFSQKDPWLSFHQRDGSEVQDPEVALTTRAQRDGEGIPVEGTEPQPALPTKEKVKEQQMPEVDPNLVKSTDPTKTEGDFCSHCTTAQTAKTAQENIEDIKKVGEEIAADNVPPVKAVTAEGGIWASDPTVMKYASSTEVRDSIRYALRNKRSRSTGYCYRYVKRALMGGDMIDRYPPGGHAREAVRDLKAQGMVNMLDNPKYRKMIKSPADVPKGAVIVYHNGTRESGDIQIKTDWGDKGSYVSDFASGSSYLNSPKARRYARLGKPYRMIGVMIKP